MQKKVTSFVEIIQEGGLLQSRFESKPITPIGRDTTNVVQLSDPMCSRNHAVINFVGQGNYYLIDMGSRNGIFLNNQRVNNPTLLSNKDTIMIGSTKLIFHKHAENAPISGMSEFNYEQNQIHPEIRSVVVLVADIRNFTQMSETLPIEVLTKAMTYWFKGTRSIIERNFGIVDKFIGDCVLAKWELKDLILL